MSDNGNGNEARGDAPPAHWTSVESDLQKVADPVVRGCLIEQLERDREQWQQRLRYTHRFEAFTKQAAERDFRIFTDMTMLLSGLTRIERRQDVQDAAIEGIAARVGRLDGERENDRESLREIDAEVRKTKRQLADTKAKDAIARVRLEERVALHERRLAELDGELDDTGQHVAVAEATARMALGSINDEREIKKEDREDKRWVVRHRVGVASTLLIAVLTAALSYAVWRLEQQENHAPARPAPTEVR